MKLLLPSTLLLLGISLSAQMPGMMSMQAATADGTSLGANHTLATDGIALGNRVKMTGFVDFIFMYDDLDGGAQTEDFSSAADVDFLFDLSPVTAELHLNAASSNSISATTTDNNGTGNTYSTTGTADGVGIEQVFGRYSFNNSFHLTFGRQLTSLGFEADEAPGLYATSFAYYYNGNDSADFRRNYKDGVRLNFNNGQFGLIFGLHDGYWANENFNGDNLAIDLAASAMIIPGLEAQLGYAQEEVGNDDISQFNAWISYNPDDLTLAMEYDNFDILGTDYWALMLLGNYQFVDWMGATLRYSHEDYNDTEADRITLALLFTITDNLFFNVEYSTTDVDGGNDYDEFYVEGLLTF